MRFFLPLLIFAPGLALAHPGHTDAAGFAQGLAHPMLGLDHLIAMLAIGAVAAFLGGAARRVVPGAFLVGMLGFGVLGLGAEASALAEHLILASVILLGTMLALALRPPLVALVAVSAMFGAAHGFAHGVEGSADAGYFAGFLLATAALHAAGLALAQWLAGRAPMALRGAGGAVVLSGITLALI